MANGPREADVRLNRQRQLMEPYPQAAAAVDEIVAEKPTASHKPPAAVDASTDGLKTGIPSNYEANLGGEPRHLTAFEVKKSPGRL